MQIMYMQLLKTIGMSVLSVIFRVEVCKVGTSEQHEIQAMVSEIHSNLVFSPSPCLLAVSEEMSQGKQLWVWRE